MASSQHMRVRFINLCQGAYVTLHTILLGVGGTILRKRKEKTPLVVRDNTASMIKGGGYVGAAPGNPPPRIH
jgi:hypothetical protein